MDQAHQTAGTEKADNAPSSDGAPSEDGTSPLGGAPPLGGEAFGALNAWGQALASKHNQAKSLVSPWVQRSLNIVSGRPAIGIIQPGADFSANQTQMLVQRLAGRSEASRVWQPDIGSISPAVFDRFAGEIVDRHQSHGSKYLIVSATEPENSSEDFPLVGGAHEGGAASKARRPASQPSAISSLPAGASFSDLAQITSTDAPPPAAVQRAPAQTGVPFMPERPPAPPRPARWVRPTSRVEEITPGGKSVVTRKALEMPAAQTPPSTETPSPEQAESEQAAEAEPEPIPTDEVQPVVDDQVESLTATVESIEADLPAVAEETEETAPPPAVTKPPSIAPTPSPDLPLSAPPEKSVQRKRAQPSAPPSKPAVSSKPEAKPATQPARKDTPPESSVKPLSRSEEVSSVQWPVEVESLPQLSPAETPAQESEPPSTSETPLPLAQSKRTSDAARSPQGETQTPQTGQPGPEEKKIKPEEPASEPATLGRDETPPEAVQRHSVAEAADVEEPSPTPSEPLLSEADDQLVSERAADSEPPDEGIAPSSLEHQAPELSEPVEEAPSLPLAQRQEISSQPSPEIVEQASSTPERSAPEALPDRDQDDDLSMPQATIQAPEATEDPSVTPLPLVQRQVDRKDEEARPVSEEEIISPEADRQPPPQPKLSPDMEAVEAALPAGDAISPASSTEDTPYSDQPSPDRDSYVPDAGPLPLAQRRREPLPREESLSAQVEGQEPETLSPRPAQPPIQASRLDQSKSIADMSAQIEVPGQADEAASPPEQPAAEAEQSGPSLYQRSEEGLLPLAQRRPDSKSEPEARPEQRQPSPPSVDRRSDDTPVAPPPAVQRQTLEPDVDGPESPEPTAAEWQVGDTVAPERPKASLPLAQRRLEPSFPDEDLSEEPRAPNIGPLPESASGIEEALSSFSAAQPPLEGEPFAGPQLPLVQRQAERAADDLEKMVLTRALSKMRLPLVESIPSRLSGPPIQRRTLIDEEAPLVHRFRAASPPSLGLVGEMAMSVGVERASETAFDAASRGAASAISPPLPLAPRSMPARTEAQDSSTVSQMAADGFRQGAASQDASTVLQRALSISRLEQTTIDSAPSTGSASSTEAVQSEPDLNQLARKILPIIKRLLAVERERMRSR